MNNPRTQPDPEIEQIEKLRKRQFAYLCIAFTFPLMVAFTFLDIFEGDVVEAVFDVLSGLALIICAIGLKKFNVHKSLYYMVMILLGSFYLYNVAIGAGKGTAIYWIYSFPLVFLFFFGIKEGAAVSLTFMFILGIIVLNPFRQSMYVYSLEEGLRFLISLLLVSLIAFGLEASREKYGRMLTANRSRLLEEKQNLEKALKEIKTLSGLVPICSNCKKIRDDEGYWQQVDVYIRNHSTVDFSHSICPDCIQLLYPGFQNADK